VIVLQEVVRGWMIDEQHDALSVLAEKLGMSYAFQPNIGDLYGNAVLSRFKLDVVKRVSFPPPETLRHQQRGALFVRTGGVLLVVTHLDDIADSSLIRQEQVRTILREWHNESPNNLQTVIAGDLNAQPGDIEVRLLDQEGFQDLGLSAGTTTGDDPAKRIDYIWGNGVVGSQAHTTQPPYASDHRGLVVNVTRSAR
jgi:endonuclease/exonuclease/phosphatase family metal-dependent hydrolase